MNKKNSFDVEATEKETPVVIDIKAKPLYEGINTFIYIGPSLPGGRLKENTVLNGTFEQVTKYCEDAISDFGGVKKLIVPAAKLAESKQKVKTPGNAMFEYYSGVVSEIGKRGVK